LAPVKNRKHGLKVTASTPENKEQALNNACPQYRTTDG